MPEDVVRQKPEEKQGMRRGGRDAKAKRVTKITRQGSARRRKSGTTKARKKGGRPESPRPEQGRAAARKPTHVPRKPSSPQTATTQSTGTPQWTHPRRAPQRHDAGRREPKRPVAPPAWKRAAAALSGERAIKQQGETIHDQLRHPRQYQKSKRVRYEVRHASPPSGAESKSRMNGGGVSPPSSSKGQ